MLLLASFGVGVMAVTWPLYSGSKARLKEKPWLSGIVVMVFQIFADTFEREALIISSSCSCGVGAVIVGSTF